MTNNDSLKIGNKNFKNRLMLGTGKYKTPNLMVDSLQSSNCEIVTVAVRRVKNDTDKENLMQYIDWSKYWMLPNTAGCTNSDEAIRIAMLGRELAKLSGQENNNFVKLEVIPNKKYLLPDPIGTLKAAEQLVKEGFTVLPYINSDPLIAKQLEEIGCATVMPLGSPIGSAQGIRNAANIAMIIEESRIPIIIDAGIGVPSEAAQALEMGADGVLINSAIALARNPVLMAKAFSKATEAGRDAYLSGRLEESQLAKPSSPLDGVISTN